MSAHDRQATPARVGAYWAWNLSEGDARCLNPPSGQDAEHQIRGLSRLAEKSAPSRIRTYAPGSGGRCSIP